MSDAKKSLGASSPRSGDRVIFYGIVAAYLLAVCCSAAARLSGLRAFLPSSFAPRNSTAPSSFSSILGSDAASSRHSDGVEGVDGRRVEKIEGALRSIVHVTHTHSSSSDTWMAAFDTLGEHGRELLRDKENGMRFVVCSDRKHPDLDKWPWLEVVEYEDANNTGQRLIYPRKVVRCLEEVVRRHDPKVILHTMEDMILTGPIRWELIAAGARILLASNSSFFRFGCRGGRRVPAKDEARCKKLQAGDARPPANRTRNETIAERMKSAGDCPAGYLGVFHTDYFGVVPMLVRPRQWIELHERHAGRNSDSGSRMETYAYSHPEEPGPGLSGFVDAGSEHRGGAELRIAYPFIHTGVQFGMWMTSDFAESLCPYMEVQGVRVAGAMDCKTDLNATPPCLCDHPTYCDVNGTRLRKFWKTKKYHPFPLGCISWAEQGRPRPKAISPIGPDVENALREEGLWEAPDLDESWASA